MRVIEYRQLIQILAIFMIVQFSGLLLATQVFGGAVFSQIEQIEVVSTYVNALFYIAYIIVFSVIILFIFKVYKGDMLFMVLEGVVVFSASFIVFMVSISALQGQALSSLYGNVPASTLAVSTALSAILIIAKYRIPRLRNFTAIIASIGVGLVIGVSFSFTIALIFMVVLAAYDFVAVFITKHMIALGNIAIDRNLSFLVMVNEVKAVPLSSLSAKEREEYNKSKRGISKQGGLAKEMAERNMAPLAARTALGTGDLAMPLMLAISAYKANLNFVLSFVIVIGAIFGLILTMLILRKYKRALPAIPPLLFGIILAMLVYFAALHI